MNRSDHDYGSPDPPQPSHPIIASMPLMHGSDLIRRPGNVLPYPLNEAEAVPCFNGRVAIWHGLRALGIGKGDRIIAPAYSCGSEIDTLLKSGAELDYYRVTSDLSADLDHVRELCRTPAAALFITHFFGFAQPLQELLEIAEEHQLFLIEDVSHGLYSTTPTGVALGSVGQMSIFSLWKTLPVPDGGVLMLKPPLSPVDQITERPSLASTVGRLRHMIEETVRDSQPQLVAALRRWITNPAENWIRPLLRKLEGKSTSQPPVTSDDRSVDVLPEADRVMFRYNTRNWRMTRLSRYVLPRVAHEDVVDRRRENYLRLNSSLDNPSSVHALLPELPPGCCPLYYPVVVNEPKPFARYLARNKIEFFRVWCVFHPNVDWSLFPRESYLKENVVVLPIHQGLNAADMDRIAQVLNNWTDPIPKAIWKLL